MLGVIILFKTANLLNVLECICWTEVAHSNYLVSNQATLYKNIVIIGVTLVRVSRKKLV